MFNRKVTAWIVRIVAALLAVLMIGSIFAMLLH